MKTCSTRAANGVPVVGEGQEDSGENKEAREMTIGSGYEAPMIVVQSTSSGVFPAQDSSFSSRYCLMTATSY